MGDFKSSGNVASWCLWRGGSDHLHCREFQRDSIADHARPNAIRWRRFAAQPGSRSTRRSNAPAGIDPQLFARAKAALDQHPIYPRDTIGIADFSKPSSEPRFHVVDLASGQVESHRVCSRPRVGSGALGLSSSASPTTLAPTRRRTAPTRPAITTTASTEPLCGCEAWTTSNSNAEPRAIVIHNAWYAEDDMIPLHGQLGRSEGCFAMSREQPVCRHAPPRRRPNDLRRQARLSGRSTRGASINSNAADARSHRHRL